MIYRCPVCQTAIPSWVAKQTAFECPECNNPLRSNLQKTFRQSLKVALVSWLTIFALIQLTSGSWGFAAAASLEGGGMLSAAVAALYYHFSVKIDVRGA